MQVSSSLAASMKTKILTCSILFLLPLMSLAANDDCDFDQSERLRNNLQLRKKYPGSRYIKEEYKLLIPRGQDEITLNIGGCVHYGVSIELKTKRTDEYDNEDAFMKKVVELIKEYSQDYIDYKKVEKSIAKKQWNNINPDTNDYYLLNYDDLSTFEVYRRHEGNFTIIGINHYT